MYDPHSIRAFQHLIHANRLVQIVDRSRNKTVLNLTIKTLSSLDVKFGMASLTLRVRYSDVLRVKPDIL